MVTRLQRQLNFKDKQHNVVCTIITHQGREHTGRTLGKCVGIQDGVGLVLVSERNP